jgi:hypothetical protein
MIFFKNCSPFTVNTRFLTASALAVKQTPRDTEHKKFKFYLFSPQKLTLSHTITILSDTKRLISHQKYSLSPSKI